MSGGEDGEEQLLDGRLVLVRIGEVGPTEGEGGERTPGGGPGNPPAFPNIIPA